MSSSPPPWPPFVGTFASSSSVSSSSRSTTAAVAAAAAAAVVVVVVLAAFEGTAGSFRLAVAAVLMGFTMFKLLGGMGLLLRPAERCPVVDDGAVAVVVVWDRGILGIGDRPPLLRLLFLLLLLMAAVAVIVELATVASLLFLRLVLALLPAEECSWGTSTPTMGEAP